MARCVDRPLDANRDHVPFSTMRSNTRITIIQRSTSEIRGRAALRLAARDERGQLLSDRVLHRRGLEPGEDDRDGLSERG